jgi:DNA-binding transcriptional ArsR family regulator
MLVPTDESGRGALAKFFMALSDPSRLRLLQFLLAEEHTVSECVVHIGLAQAGSAPT